MSNEMNISTSRGHLQALAFARKGGSALGMMLYNIAKAKQVERMGVIQSMLFLETHFTEDDAAAVPVVGSKMGETGNQPYDRYTVEVQTKDGKRKVPGSWFTDVVNNLPIVTDDVNIRIAILDGDEDETLETDAKWQPIRAAYARLGTGEKATERKMLRAIKTDMRTGLTKGSMLLHHAAEIDALNPAKIKVKMPIRTEKVIGDDGADTGETRLVVFSNIVRLIDPSKEIEDKTYTVSEFLALDPAKLDRTKTIDLAALELTKARKPRGGAKGKTDTNAANQMKPPTTVEGLLHAFNAISTALDVETDAGVKLMAQFMSRLADKGDKGDDAVDTFGTMALAIDPAWTDVNNRYLGIQQAKARAANINKHEPNADLKAAFNK